MGGKGKEGTEEMGKGDKLGRGDIREKGEREMEKKDNG